MEKEIRISEKEDLVCLLMTLPENVVLTLVFEEEGDEHGKKEHI